MLFLSPGKCITLALVKGVMGWGGDKVRPKQTEEGKTGPCGTSITAEELVSVAVEVVNERAAQGVTSEATDVKGQAELLTLCLSEEAQREELFLDAQEHY